MTTLQTKDPSTILYLDASGIDDNEVYTYGWGIKGNRIYGMKNAERQKRLSFISTIHGNKHIAPLVFEGTCDRRVFETYIEKVLLPVLKPGQTLGPIQEFPV